MHKYSKMRSSAVYFRAHHLRVASGEVRTLRSVVRRGEGRKSATVWLAHEREPRAASHGAPDIVSAYRGE